MPPLNIVDPDGDVQFRIAGDGSTEAVVDGYRVQIETGGMHEYRVRWNGNRAEVESLAQLTNVLNRWL